MKHLLASILAILTFGSITHAHEGDTATPAGGGIKALVYSNTAYYRHPDIPGMNRWLVLLGHENGFDVDVTEHWKDLEPAVLARYDVLVLNNANQLDKVIPDAQRKSVEEWFAKGKKGIVALHATLVEQKQWPWLTQLGGCDFNSHDLRSLGTPFVRKHILAGIRWAAGEPAKSK